MEIQDNQYKELVNLSKKREEKYYSWLKNILLIATGLLSVLVSLHKGDSKNFYEKILFAITVSTLGLGILTGSVVLYKEVNNLDRLWKEYYAQLRRQHATGVQPDNTTAVDSGSVFLICEVVCYVSLCSALISMIWYAIQLDY